ncbi:hypothetical protein C0J52_10437 [Blattella germanica]|nr:hypothetical protein C0J52_10437 [Blattella germanica]
MVSLSGPPPVKLISITGGPGTYAFGYDVDDPVHGNIQFRQEERHPNGTVTGSYGVLEPDGNVKVVHYVADNRGYRATIERIKKRQGGGQADDPNSDTNVVYPQYFPSMTPPVLGHSYLHVKHKPQYSNPYPPVNYPNYVYKTYPYPQPYSQSRGVSQYRL